MKHARTRIGAATPLLLLAAASLSSCTITIGGDGETSFFRDDGRERGRILLAERTDDEGGRTRFRLVRSGDEEVAIHREETRGVELPYLGVKGRSVDSDTATDRALTPWRGILVSSVTSGTAAEDAGIVSGDVIVSMAGVELTSYEQFVELAGAQEPGSTIEMQVSSAAPDGEGRQERVLDFGMGVRLVDESAVTRVPLQAEPLLLERAGVEVATLPEDLVRDIHGLEGTRAMVTGVWLGGPAYREGLRGGDLVERVNGVEVRDAGEIAALVQSDARRLDFEVSGPLGEHRASVGLIDDVTESSDFGIPILVGHSSRVGRSRTSVLDFIFQFGWNHRRRALPSDTRETRTSSYLSILPFGMFEFTRRPGVSKNRIFWFITWGKGS